MTHLERTLVVLSIVVTCCFAVSGQETEEQPKQRIEAPSPDGQFAFRYAKGSVAETKTTDEESESPTETYDLIEKKSGKVLMRIAESDPDPAPSSRFNMEVLWRPDSRAFAVTETLWKRGSNVEVYMRNGATFRHIEIPELTAEIPAKLEQGKTTNINSQRATRWQKDGSLVIEIETVSAGNGGMTTATRSAVLAFDRTDKAKVRKSTIKFAVEK